MRRLLPNLAILTAGLCLLAGCRKETTEVKPAFGFNAFVPIYNRHITAFLKEKQATIQKEIAKAETALGTAQGDAKTKLENRLTALRREAEKYAFRLSVGDYFKFNDPSEVPADLVWENGGDQPEIGDPNAKKGGVVRRHIIDLSYPPTLRPFGPSANFGFRGDLYDHVEMHLVGLHPATNKEIPAVAKEWAFTPDRRKIFFRLDPDATYSDGVHIKSIDFLYTIYLRVSDNVVNPFTKEQFRDTYAQIATYGDDIVAITLPEPTVYAAWVAGADLPPAPSHFYKEYGPDYAERYNWKFPPTSGAYEVKPEDIIKGVSLTQTRVKNWWAKDRKYYKYRYNPDKLVHVLVRDESKAFELFRAGELDTFLILAPDAWYEKTEIPPVYDGYIEKTTFYHQYPRIPRGIFMNVTKPPLDDRNVRLGIQHSMNFQKVIEVLYRGDYARLNSFNEGIGIFSDPSIRALPFSIESARAAFREAGYTLEGSDGILAKPDGTRLSVSVSYISIPRYDRIFAILREESKACGLDLRLDGLETNVFYKKIMQKQHEMNFSGWDSTPPIPEFFQFLHSESAFDDRGNPKPDTNNFFVWARNDTDMMIDRVKYARTDEEMRDGTYKLQNLIHDEGIFVPSYKIEFTRIANWRWLRWPDCPETRFSPPIIYEPHESYVFWVDEEMQKDTLKAIHEGRTFPEVNRVADAYRTAPPQTPPPDQ